MSPSLTTLDPLHPLIPVVALLVAFATLSLLPQPGDAPARPGRHDSIDGLRGYLAFFVYLHHAASWFFYLRQDQWMLPPSHLYTHLGQSSVALFFMITGFLFCSKLMDGRRSRIDWLKLYVSRVLRLLPLYLLLILLLLACVAVLSGGELREPLPDLMRHIAGWVFFTIPGMQDINGVKGSFIIVSGVTWSLVYEWFFYGSLPVLGLAFGVRPGMAGLLAGCIGMAAIAWGAAAVPFSLTFLGGIAAAILVRRPSFRQLAQSRMGSLIAIACLGTVVLLFPSAQGKPQLLLLSLAFAIMAGGNDVFGLMTHRLARALGELAYGIYLLHGIVLFVVFSFIIGIPTARTLSPAGHWLIVLAVTPALVLLCMQAFRWIEQPAMRHSSRLTAGIRSLRFRRAGLGRSTGPEA